MQVGTEPLNNGGRHQPVDVTEHPGQVFAQVQLHVAVEQAVGQVILTEHRPLTGGVAHFGKVAEPDRLAKTAHARPRHKGGFHQIIYCKGVEPVKVLQQELGHKVRCLVTLVVVVDREQRGQ